MNKKYALLYCENYYGNVKMLKVTETEKSYMYQGVRIAKDTMTYEDYDSVYNCRLATEEELERFRETFKKEQITNTIYNLNSEIEFFCNNLDKKNTSDNYQKYF